MTFQELQRIITDNNIPTDVRLVSDSGWECGETEMNGVYYSQSRNKIAFTQNPDDDDCYYNERNDWILLTGGTQNV